LLVEHAIEPAEHRSGVVALPSLLQLGRRAIPQAFEAAIVPSALFIVVAHYFGDNAGIGAALGFAVAVILWRFLTARRVPGMMVLAIVTLVARSVLAFVSGSTFLYFLQPSVAGCCLAAAFLVSVTLKRPLARRFADDFCALPGHILAEEHVHRFFCRLSVMWGAVGLAKTALILWLLATQTTSTYVVSKTAISIGVTVVAVAVSVVWFRRSIAQHGLVAVTA
jgi:intracellular septation protein A